MIVKATEIKNNLGKYLKLLDQEDIIILKNGSPVAKLTKQEGWNRSDIDYEQGIRTYAQADCVGEQAEVYGSHGIKMSYEEFMEMYENTDERYEYIDGEVFRMTSPRVTHQHVLGNLYAVFRLWFHGKRCMPYLSPFDVTLKKGEKGMNVVQPDLLVVCDPENKNEKDRYTGIPSLVVEILSQSTTRMDLVRKMDLYMQTGIQEYWVINHSHQEVIVYRFADRNIADMRVFSKTGAAQSFVFEGLEADLEELFS